ncbi:MAG: penicillin-binding protein 2 [Candidatus Saccharimonadales bacterium]
MILAATVCVGRLFQLQVINHDIYALRANQEHLRKYEVPAERGTIYMLDRATPAPVAFNRILKTMYADPRYIDDPAATATVLADITGKEKDDYLELISQKDKVYMVLEKSLLPKIAEKIEALELYGIGFMDEPSRVYPEKTLGSQVLGYVNSDGEGQYGIEQYFNKELRGAPGLLDGKTDTRGIPIATSDNIQIEPQAGSDIILTIDRNIQARVEQIVKAGHKEYRAKLTSAIVMEAGTGKIRAMANYPTFDPNNYQKVEDYSLFMNPAATGLFEPGSNLKLLTMAAGLEEGVIEPQSQYYNKGYEVIDGYKIENAEFFGARYESMIDTIAHSVNSGAIHVLRMLSGGSEITLTGQQKLYNYFTNRFNIGSQTGIEVPGEPDGYISKPGESSNSNYANMTFGQGLTATMTHVISAVNAIVNGGTYYQPTLVEKIVNKKGETTINEPKVLHEDIVNHETSKQIRNMMEKVILEGGGFSTRIEGYRIGGKTGTAQIPSPEGGYYLDRDIGSFVGFVGTGDAKYVLLVRVDEPGYTTTGWAGSGAAAPIFGDIMRWLLQYQGMPPTN